MNRLMGTLCGVLFALVTGLVQAQSAPPAVALKYRPALIRASHVVWGINAPVAVFAAQIQQESAWREAVCSPFACGLTQFTPETADWIAGHYPEELGAEDARAARFDPQWSIQALVRYDRHLYDRIQAAGECDRMAMTLSAYNGGPGWVTRDKALAQRNGADPLRWWGHVERYSARAKWAFTENRDYPHRILYTHQPRYRGWGRTVCLEQEE